MGSTSVVTIDYIKNQMVNIKNKYKRIYTNCYKELTAKDITINFYEDDYSIVFIIKDESIYRGYFYSANLVNLRELLGKCDANCIIEIIAKNNSDLYRDVLEASGFTQYSIFRRYTNGNIRENLTKNIPHNLLDIDVCSYGEVATYNDVDDLYSLLYDIFDHAVSHLPTNDELMDMVDNNQVLVQKSEDKIVAFLIYKVDGQGFYINQIYNNSEKGVIHCILMKALKTSMLEGVSYAYAWVEDTNIKSIKFHQRYGMEFDGLISIAYKKIGV